MSAAVAVSFQGRIIVASTLVTAEGRSIGIWSSSDGVEWSLDVPESLSGSQATDLIVGPHGLVLAGNRVGPGSPTPGSSARAAIWTSPDGRAWTDVASGPEFDTGWINSLATDGDEILAIGNVPFTTPGDEACPTATIWRSQDGAAWESMTPPEPCVRPFRVAGHDGRFVVLGAAPDPAFAGMPGATKTVAWFVQGDAPWKRLDAVPPAGAMYDLVGGPSGFLLVAGSNTVVDVAPPSALYSPDGEAWTPVEGDVFQRGPGNQPPLIALGFADAFFVNWVRRDAEGKLETALFRSPDGRTWTPVPPSLALDHMPPLASVLLHEGSVIGFGGRAQILAWVSPPSATSPEPTTFAEPQVVETPMPGGGIPRAMAFDGDAALAIGSSIDPATTTVLTGVWRWSPTAGWTTVETTGLDGAEVSGLARGPGGWVAIGWVRGPRVPNDPSQGIRVFAHAWTSVDGHRWTAVPLDVDHVGVTIDRLTAITGSTAGYIAVGLGFESSCGASASSASVLLTSPDGRAWTPVDDPDLACRQVNAVVSGDGRLVAVGAETRLITTASPSSTPCGMDVCLVGTARPEARPAVWVSEDGREWSPAVGLDLGWGGTGFTSVAAGPAGYIATWAGDTLFSSLDGLTWAPTYLPIGQSAVGAKRVAGTRDGYFALGSYLTLGADGQGPVDRFSLFFSADGRTWQEVAPTSWSPEPGTYVSAMGGADGAGFLILGTKQGQQPTNLSWLVGVPGS